MTSPAPVRCRPAGPRASRGAVAGMRPRVGRRPGRGSRSRRRVGMPRSWLSTYIDSRRLSIVVDRRVLTYPAGAMTLDRDDIERRDFPTARRGYEPSAVDAHLRRLADEMEKLGRPAPAPPGLAAGTSEQGRAILEAAEAGAAELRAEAGAEARGHVERVEGATNDMVDRLGRLQGELDRLLGALRASADVLSEGLLDMRARVEEMGASVEVPEIGGAAEPPGRPALGGAGGGRAGLDGSDLGGPPVDEPAADEGVAEEPTASAPAPVARSTDEEGARLAALDLALGGRPREEAERYLTEHFDLADPGALLDDVYARVGR